VATGLAQLQMQLLILAKLILATLAKIRIVFLIVLKSVTFQKPSMCSDVQLKNRAGRAGDEWGGARKRFTRDAATDFPPMQYLLRKQPA